jgi:hypothetical protein
MVTQRGPYRDGAVGYRDSKYYGLSRIDTINDGINREITQELTDKRRPGSAVYNNLVFPAALSFYSWKYIQNKAEVVRVLEDGADGVIYDATAGQKSTLFTKSTGAGPARFLGVNTELFIADGVDTKKVVRSAKTWTPNTIYKSGDFIVDSNGNIQVAYGAVAVQANFTAITNGPHVAGAPVTYSTVFMQLNVLNTPFAETQVVGFLNFTAAAVLNGKFYQVGPAAAGVLLVDRIPFTTPYPGGASDTGIVYSNGDSGLTGTSGAVQPVWATGLGLATIEPPLGTGHVVWINKGPATQNWGMATPTVAPTLLQLPTSSLLQRWAANTYYFTQQVVIDPGGTLLIGLVTGGVTAGVTPAFNPVVGQATPDGTAVWVTLANATPSSTWAPGVVTVAGAYVTYPVAGLSYVFKCVQSGTTAATAPLFLGAQGAYTADGTNVIWQNIGALFAYAAIGTSRPVSIAQSILDPDGFAQKVSVSGISGAAIPTFDDTSSGALTPDNTMTWIRGTEISVAASAVAQYAYSWKSSVTRNVSTASPLSVQILRQADKDVLVQGPGPTDPQDDMIEVWRTAQGKSTLIYDGQIPILGLGLVWSFLDTLPSDEDLIAQIAAPIANQNDPPASNITAPIYHLQRIWAIVDNTVVYSGGPDTLVGAGTETFPPLNEIPYPSQPIRLIPVTVQNGGIIVMTTSGAYIILGTGTASNPFYTTIYYASVNLAGYDAVDVYNTAIFLMESNAKVSTLAVEYPFNPQTGYTEIGFPIGDQFQKVTTGGINANLYNPATAYVSWNIASSGDTNMFVADGSVGWFSMNMINPPEQGILWNPRAAITGGTSAVQSIEVSPGVQRLLIGPANGATGPILMRDPTGTQFSDNGPGYPAWDAKGVILLCATGQWAEVAHISTKSAALGARPKISTLMGEIQPTPNHPWTRLNLTDKSNDPPETPKSESVFSDRYLMAENGVPYTGDCITVKFDYGSQTVGDELLDWGIFASLMNERDEQVAPS